MSRVEKVFKFISVNELNSVNFYIFFIPVATLGGFLKERAKKYIP